MVGTKNLNSSSFCASTVFILCLLSALGMSSGSFFSSESHEKSLTELKSNIEETISQAKQNIWNQMEPDGPFWNMPPWLGTLFISEYYFSLKAINLTGDLQNFTSKFNQTFFTEKLISEQREDGSWIQVTDLNKQEGFLDATILNYWFLKDVGVDMSSVPMRNARKFILNNGGIQEAQVMTKYKLAAFGQYQWHLIPYVPLFIFKNYAPFGLFYIKDYVGQWVYPHIIALAYLRYHKTIYPVSTVCLSQLRTSRSAVCEDQMLPNPGISSFKPEEKDTDVENLLRQAINIKGPNGLIGAYTVSTLLCMMAFKDYNLRYQGENGDVELNAFFTSTVEKSISFVDSLYFNRRVPYEGSLDDGRYWDTLLSVFALHEAGQSAEKIHPTLEYLINTAVQPNGGIPYGLEFQYAPDIDDTAILLALYGAMNKTMPSSRQYSFGNYSNEINRTYEWLKSNQNYDGGFPAFDRDKNDGQYKFIKMLFKVTRIDKSAEIFDPSCPDIVGHILEGMGQAQLYHKASDFEVINRAVEYLYNTKNSEMWSARWGINYVYAVGSVFPGLSRIGYNLNQTWLLDVIRKLKTIQQEDGGFGEDDKGYSLDTYEKGVTTASMTSWGLLAYLEVAEYIDVKKNIIQAVEYLLKNFKENGNKFHDRSVVGTGHRGVLNLQYPVYAYTFPTIALARALNYLRGEKKAFINEEVNKNVIQYDIVADIMETVEKKPIPNENSTLTQTVLQTPKDDVIEQLL